MYFTSCLAQSGVGEFKYHYEGRRALANACVNRNRQAINFFKDSDPSTIFLHQYTGYEGEDARSWFDAAALLVSTLERFGHKVVWVGSVVYPNKLLASCIAVPRIYSDKQLSSRCKGDSRSVRRVFARNELLEMRFKRHYVNVNSYFCKGREPATCSHMLDNVPAFRDKHHLTVPSSISLIRWVKLRL